MGYCLCFTRVWLIKYVRSFFCFFLGGGVRVTITFIQTSMHDVVV